MDGQKQIEEMAKAIRPVLENRTDIGYIPDLDKSIAKELLKHYQPKLPEDSVVLTSEEFDNLRLQIQEAHHKGVQAGYDMTKFKEHSIEQKARKETARECRDFIKQWVGNDEEGLGFLFDFEDFIVKKYGVKILK